MASSPLIPILAIGLAGFQGLSAAQMAEATKSMAAAAEVEAGIAFEGFFVHAEPPTQEREDLKQKLRSKQWAVVQIGSGLRLAKEQTAVLEDVVNLVLENVRPAPMLAFPTRPEEMIPTFKRLLERRDASLSA